MTLPSHIQNPSHLSQGQFILRQIPSKFVFDSSEHPASNPKRFLLELIISNNLLEQMYLLNAIPTEYWKARSTLAISFIKTSPLPRNLGKFSEIRGKPLEVKWGKWKIIQMESDEKTGKWNREIVIRGSLIKDEDEGGSN